jgi:hypothetical protein
MTGEGGVKVLSQCEPREVRRDSEGRLLVTWFDALQGTACNGTWDTVLFATGKKGGMGEGREGRERGGGGKRGVEEEKKGRLEEKAKGG